MAFDAHICSGGFSQSSTPNNFRGNRSGSITQWHRSNGDGSPCQRGEFSRRRSRPLIDGAQIDVIGARNDLTLSRAMFAATDGRLHTILANVEKFSKTLDQLRGTRAKGRLEQLNADIKEAEGQLAANVAALPLAENARNDCLAERDKCVAERDKCAAALKECLAERDKCQAELATLPNPVEPPTPGPIRHTSRAAIPHSWMLSRTTLPISPTMPCRSACEPFICKGAIWREV